LIHGSTEEENIEIEKRQPSRAPQVDGAEYGELSAVPPAKAFASRLPQLRLLSRPASNHGRLIVKLIGLARLKPQTLYVRHEA